LSVRSSTSDTTVRSSSPWGPLAQPIFRAVWLAALASNIGTLMQGVAAAWLMTALTTSPAPVALLTTMANLPLFLVGLPAGALADVVDRRRLVLLTQIWMLVVASVLGVVALLGWISPGLLLALTFLISLGGALGAPAWQAIVPQLVPRRDLPSAVALNSAGFNLARAIGPALGGLVVAASGPAAVFLLNAASFLAVIAVMARWRPPPRPQLERPEPVRSAVAAGLRFARHAPPLRAVLVRTAAWIVAASALLSLLPVVAARQLGLDAFGYGVLLGSLGIGAVGGAALMPRLRARWSTDRLAVGMTLIFAAALFALAGVRNLLALNAMLVLAGVAWLSVNAFLNVAAQTLAPAWVQARALGIYLLVSQGGLAAGSALWGLVADRFGAPVALAAAGVALIIGLATVRRWPLLPGDTLDLRPSNHWPAPHFEREPAAEEGPVLVMIDYRVAQENQADFCAVMSELALIRRRDGATRWRLFRDAADPERLIETFLVPSWAEYLRQHERVTVADRAVEERALALRKPGTEAVTSHFIAADSA